MYSDKKKIDGLFLFLILLITFVGFVMFLSASFSTLASDTADFQSTAIKQGIGLIVGIISFWLISRFPYTWIKKSAFYIMLCAIAINLILFIPGLSIFHGGATRWLNLGFISFQPSEILKIATIICVAAWLHSIKDKITKIRYGLSVCIIILGIVGSILYSQSDTDTLIVIASTVIFMFFVAGLPWKHLLLIVAIGAIALAGLVSIKPYIKERVITFIDGGADTQGAGYQINQAKIAIGSGQITGKGFGQSLQKFGYLPQPTDDSIFAVIAEEFGLIGSLGIIILYLTLVTKIFAIATKSRDSFGANVAAGLGFMIAMQSFMNISTMIGIFPLSGMPLLFISRGGTSLAITLASMGIVASISKFRKP